MLLLLLACASSPQDSGPEVVDTGPFPPGTLSLSFGIDADHLERMQEEPVGAFYGSFWRGDQVDGAGPFADAESLGDIFVAEVDFRDGVSTPVLFESPELPPIEVVVLGFMDSDANSTDESRRPDDKDPVTLPADNDFDVVSGEATQVQVFFGLLNP